MAPVREMSLSRQASLVDDIIGDESGALLQVRTDETLISTVSTQVRSCRLRVFVALLSGIALICAGVALGSPPRTPLFSHLETNEKGHHVHSLELSLWGKGGRKEVADSSELGWARSAIVLNEVMANPSSGKEWVEIYNRGDKRLDMKNWEVVDKKGYRGKWSGTTTWLDPRSHLVVEFKGKLNNKDETIELKDPSGFVVDIAAYAKTERGNSFARIPDGCPWNKVLQSAPTKGEQNPSFVVINEVMAHPLSGLEWVELYNPSHCDVDISGWSLKESKGYSAFPYFQNSIKAKGYLVVTFSKKLNNGGDIVTLYGKRGEIVDKFEYTKADRDRTWARSPDSGPWSRVPQIPSKGRPNPVASPTEAPVPPPLFGRGCGSCDGLCFGTWNIQTLGNAKSGRPAVMAIIRQVLGRYDLANIQELSQMPRAPYVCGDYTESTICAARPNTEYTVYASPRIGDEQYVVIAKNSMVQPMGKGGTYPDPNGIHSRPPHAFEFLVTAGTHPFEIVVAGTHTTPKNAGPEIKNFRNVLAWMVKQFPKVTRSAGAQLNITTKLRKRRLSAWKRHYVLAGDFNADGSYFNDELGFPFSALPGWGGYTMLTKNNLDTTVASNDNTYDRIVVDSDMATNAGPAEVFHYDRIDLSGIRDEGCRLGYVPKWVCATKYDNIAYASLPLKVRIQLAKEVSDHYPVEVCLRG